MYGTIYMWYMRIGFRDTISFFIKIFSLNAPYIQNMIMLVFAKNKYISIVKSNL